MEFDDVRSHLTVLDLLRRIDRPLRREEIKGRKISWAYNMS